MRFSVVIATYNRGPILEKCLRALMAQTFSKQRFEIVVVDDGSTDDTPNMVARLREEGGMAWQYHRQENQGRAHARNVGIDLARGEIVVFIDSDVVVIPTFLAEHDRLHTDERLFVQGLAVDTDRFDDPCSTPVGPTAFSAAFFATNNVSIRRKFLLEAGKFDEDFTEYGWEDLELGLRLKGLGLRMVRSRTARGFHWHPAFTVKDLPSLKRIEQERGRMAALFYRKHPTLEVRLMIQLTAFHQILNSIVTLGGRLNESNMAPVLEALIQRGFGTTAKRLALILLNQYNLVELHAALDGRRRLAAHG